MDKRDKSKETPNNHKLHWTHRSSSEQNRKKTHKHTHILYNTAIYHILLCNIFQFATIILNRNVEHTEYDTNIQ